VKVSTFLDHPKTGVRHFFVPRPLDTPAISISGIGIREPMNSCMFDRYKGTGDYLIMLFHDPAQMDVHPITDDKTAAASTMMIWPTGAPQHYGNRTQGFSHSWIHCEGRRIKAILTNSLLPQSVPFFVPANAAAHFQQSLNDLYTELVSQTRPDEVIAGNLLENTLRLIARSRAITPTGSQMKLRLLEVHNHIAGHYAEPLDLRSLAGLAGMSVPYFCAQFKQTFKISPISCIIRQRMQHARYLLANPELIVAEIALKVGYEDAFHFSKMFKRHFGVSPLTFRKGQRE
jgi:AraC family transcriptional regulator, arabinose operon regulatory protein